MMNHGIPTNKIPVAQARTRSLFAKTKQTLRHIFLIGALYLSLFSNYSQAQCPAGTQQAILNWDYLDYFTYTGNYTSGNGYLPSNALSATQNFAFGTQRLTIVHNYTAINNLVAGDNTTHTGEAGTYGDVNPSATDADIQFIGNGQIILTFENEVRNLRFSMYDIDRSPKSTLDARNAANVAQNVTMATFAGTIITLTNNGTPTARCRCSAGIKQPITLPQAAIDIDIAGPVKTVTLNITNTTTNGSEDGSFWISDILACSAGTFPSNYYQVSQPFTGQPGYVLHSFDKSVYAVDPATGKTKLLFTDP